MFEITLEESISAAHALRAYRGACERAHGHNYRVRVTLEGEQLDEAGLLMDFVELRHLLREVLEPFDHRMLNEVAPFDSVNPTAENLARHFFEELEQRLAGRSHVRVREVRVWETPGAAAAYRR
jgi:6-pyruvoyltetrahydropterin/6-carboxytetrahydropterin synthase